jgi:DNA-binding NarL/FixJ family response regulator
MRIILADHHTEPRWALKALLDEEEYFELVSEAIDSPSLLQLAESQTADLILIDEKLPGSPIEDLIIKLHAINPRPIVIVMSSDSTCSRKMLQAGADSFVSKADQPEWLIQSLRKYVQHNDLNAQE